MVRAVCSVDRGLRYGDERPAARPCLVVLLLMAPARPAHMRLRECRHKMVHRGQGRTLLLPSLGQTR